MWFLRASLRLIFFLEEGPGELLREAGLEASALPASSNGVLFGSEGV